MDATEEFELKKADFNIYALESGQPGSTNLFEANIDYPAALLFGSETEGLDQSVLDQANAILEIPMVGSKESLNVAVAAGIAIYTIESS